MGVLELRPRRPRTAFVLGGGGNLGAVQIGMLKALFERNITPDVIVGCSVGAVKVRAHRAMKQLREAYLNLAGEAST